MPAYVAPAGRSDGICRAGAGATDTAAGFFSRTDGIGRSGEATDTAAGFAGGTDAIKGADIVPPAFVLGLAWLGPAELSMTES
jgi:hypothetical protein